MDIACMTRSVLSSVALLASIATAPVQAVTLDFFCLTNTSASDCTTGESQLSVGVTDAGGGQVLFTFNNSGPNASSITDVYFDDGSLLGIASIDNSSSGVSFSQGASPGNLPSGNTATPAFVVTAGFLADSDPAVQPNGVNPNEWLGILFNLQGSQTFANVLTDLGNGDLRIGIHVQGFNGGGSESFINNPVPVPAAVWLFGSGLLGLAGIARKRS